jgi:hypothetical protein
LGLWLVLTLGLTLSACSAIDVHTDFDQSVDFTAYHSYSWAQRPVTGSPLMDERMVNALNAQLQLKGWRLMPDGQGDAVLFGVLTTRENERIDTTYSGMGPGLIGRGFYMGGGFGNSSAVVTTYLVGTLILDMFDTRSHKPLWRGTASGTISNNPDKNVRNVQEAFEKMFQNFPPGIKR